MYIHVCIPFKFTTVFNTKDLISGVYNQLLDKHKEPFKDITKSVTEVSLSTIQGSLEDFRDIIKALPQTTEILMPGQPKRFIAIGISIAAMVMSNFNTVWITQLNAEITTLKAKTYLICTKSISTIWTRNWSKHKHCWPIYCNRMSGFPPK